VIIAIGDVYARVPNRRAVEQVMLAAQAQTRRQDGCMSYAFAETLDEPGHYLLVQSWSDERALDAHYRSPAFADYQAAVAPLLARDSELRISHVAETVRPLESSGLSLGHDD
jgi:quinol monooxygenase YgiN